MRLRITQRHILVQFGDSIDAGPVPVEVGRRDILIEPSWKGHDTGRLFIEANKILASSTYGAKIHHALDGQAQLIPGPADKFLLLIDFRGEAALVQLAARQMCRAFSPVWLSGQKEP